MKKVLSDNITKILMTLLILFFIGNIIISPSKYIESALNGLSAFTFSVLPSVFPFMFFTKLLTSLGVMDKLTKPFSRLTSFVYRTSPLSAYCFFMAILSGYPVGSKMVSDLYLSRKISRTDAFRMTSFCSTSGPMFIIGAVGSAMFKNVTVGYILFISHALGALVNGLIYRNITAKEDKVEVIATKENKTFSDIISSSVQSILMVGGIIIVFFIIIDIFSPLLSFLPLPLSGLFQGIIEMTRGCLTLSTLQNIKLATVLCSFLISFGGISTVIQAKAMLDKVGMPTSLYVLQKITHGLLSVVFTLPLLFLL